MNKDCLQNKVWAEISLPKINLTSQEKEQCLFKQSQVSDERKTEKTPYLLSEQREFIIHWVVTHHPLLNQMVDLCVGFSDLMNKRHFITLYTTFKSFGASKRKIQQRCIKLIKIEIKKNIYNVTIFFYSK